MAQYFHYCYFPRLVQEKSIIEQKILSFWDEVKDFVPHESYVIDFAIVDSKVFVIEINPYV